MNLGHRRRPELADIVQIEAAYGVRIPESLPFPDEIFLRDGNYFTLGWMPESGWYVEIESRPWSIHRRWVVVYGRAHQIGYSYAYFGASLEDAMIEVAATLRRLREQSRAS
jgi:hypothetical protein